MANLNIQTTDSMNKPRSEAQLRNDERLRQAAEAKRLAKEAGEELTPAPVLSEPVLTTAENLTAAETKPVAVAKKTAVKDIDEMTDAEAVAAAEAENARQFLREARAKQKQNADIAADTVNMRERIMNAPKVLVRVPFQEGKPLMRTPKVNGVKYNIPVEEDKWVPLPVAEALNESMRTEFTNYKRFKQGEAEFLKKKNVIFR